MRASITIVLACVVLLSGLAVGQSFVDPEPAPTTTFAASLAPPTLGAAVSESFSASTSGTTSAIPVSSGDAVYVFVSQNGTIGTPSVKASSTLPFVQRGQGARGTFLRTTLFEADNVPASPSLTVTVSFTEAQTFAVAVVDLVGGGASPDDTVGGFATGGSGPGAQPKVNTTVANDLVLGVIGDTYNGPVTGYEGSTTVTSTSVGSPAVITLGVVSQTDPTTGWFTIWGNMGTKTTSSASFAIAIKTQGIVPPPTLYSVSVDPSGLPSGTSWSLTLGGTLGSNLAPGAIIFSEPNGTYFYTVWTVPGYEVTQSSGSVTVAGANPSTVDIQFATFPPNSKSIQHVVVIMLENENSSSVWSKTSGGFYEQYLASHYGNATDFYAACHDSAPNYMAVTGGSTNNECVEAKQTGISSGRNIGDLMQAAGLSWDEYMESLPPTSTTPCNTSTGITNYYNGGHNPFIEYSDVVNPLSVCENHVFSSQEFNASLEHGKLGNYSLYIPNDFDDGHTTAYGVLGNLSNGDAWLKGFLGPILNGTENASGTGNYGLQATRNEVTHTAFFILYDEGKSASYTGYISGPPLPACEGISSPPDASVCGGQTYMSVVSPYSLGTTWTQDATQYSVESTIEWLFGLGSDGGNDSTPYFPPLTGLFAFQSNGFGSNVTFEESGLPTGTNWSVTLGGVSQSAKASEGSHTSSIVFVEPNGTYQYSVGPAGGFMASPSSGQVTVNGASKSVFETYALPYSVTFTETGLASGTTWNVTMGSTVGHADSPTSIVFPVSNGTYPFTVGPILGYSVAPGSGNAVVSGSSITYPITFTAITYPATFTESGLPSGRTFQVTVNGNTMSLTTDGSTDTLTFTGLANGSYPYTITGNSGWYQSTLAYTGTVVVIGGALTEPTLVYTQVTYSVVFSESGLPSGQTFQVTVNGSAQELTTDGATDPLTFTGLVNGTYPYSVTGIAGWYQSSMPSTGTVPVAGGSVTEPTLAYSPLETFSAVFSESGLPSGQTFQVTVNGVPMSLTTDGGTDTLTFPGLTNGTYSYTVTSDPGWYQSTLTYTGSVVVDGTAVIEPTLVYTLVTYSVAFSEAGLPSGLTWNVLVNGVSEYLTTDGGTDSLTWTGLANGTFSYTITGNSGWSQLVLPYSGTLTISGAPVTEPTLVYAQVTYSVVFSESGLPSGLTFQVTLNSAAESVTTNGGTDSLTFTGLANGTYSYTIAGISGWYQPTLPYTGTVVVSGGAVAEPTLVYAQVTYSVVFSESGLPSGQAYQVMVNGVAKSLTTDGGTDSLTWAGLANGTYPYTITGDAGWHQSTLAYGGNVVVNGLTVTEPTLVYNQVTYSVMFSERGLPSGLMWTVTVNSMPESLTTDGGTDSLTWTDLANGSYVYTVSGNAGWHQSTLPYSGNVVVNGLSVTEPTLAYNQVTYSVKFSESGLPSGLTWAVTVNSLPKSLTTDGGTDSLTWTGLANGTYPYTITGNAGWHQTKLSYSGTQTINGGSVTKSTLVYSQVTYSVKFSESGLKSGLTWKVKVNGVTKSLTTSSGTNTLTWTGLANGTYSYSITDNSGWHQTTLAYSGSLTVNGATVTEPKLVYSQVTYSVTFTESGLPSGTTWSVKLNGVTKSSTGPSIVFTEPNGTFSYTVGHVAGYTASPSSGSVTVSGASAAVSVQYS